MNPLLSTPALVARYATHGLLAPHDVRVLHGINPPAKRACMGIEA